MAMGGLFARVVELVVEPTEVVEVVLVELEVDVVAFAIVVVEPFVIEAIAASLVADQAPELSWTHKVTV